jgi:hypothetical protein
MTVDAFLQDGADYLDELRRIAVDLGRQEA